LTSTAAMASAPAINRSGSAPQSDGLGVTLIAVCHALPHLERGALVRLLPQWYADGGPISIYYASRTLLPAKTRAFVDFVAEAFRRDRMAERFAGSLS